jgi:GNAT superfamily N-acetyltransferase
MSFSIRRIRPDDGALSRGIRLRALSTDPLSFGSTYQAEAAQELRFWSESAKRHAESEDCAIFIAFQQEEPVGLVRGGRDATRPGCFFVHSMWVAPEQRGHGIASALLKRVEDWIASKGGTTAELMVTDAASVARHLYEGAGYVADGYTEPSKHSGVVEHRMRKPL